MPVKNSEKYYFADFTRKNYRELIRLAKQRFDFKWYSEIDGQKQFMLWRHDMDFSPQSARKLAIIEAEEKVKSTYFLLPHSDFYNLLEKDIFDCIKDILKLGHDIGLHFDSQFYNIKDIKKLEEKLKFEKELLEEVFERKINVFSFHNPDVFELSCTEYKYAGLINTYANYFKNEIGYCSDSNGYWRHQRLKDVLLSGSYDSLQVLTHAEWWQDEVMSPKQRVLRCLKGREDNAFERYDALLRKMNRENIDW